MQAWFVLNVYAALLISMLMFFNYRRESRRSIQAHAFGQLLLMLLILVVMDSLSRNGSGAGTDSTADELAVVGTYIVMAFHPFIYYFSLKYVNCWFDEEGFTGTDPVSLFVGGWAVVNFIFVTVNQLFDVPFFFNYDDGVYTQCTSYSIRGAVNLALYLVIDFYVVYNRKRINQLYRKVIIAFPLICFGSGIGQVMFSDIPVLYSGIVFACLALYIYVQNRDINEDYLTGAVNRRRIDYVLNMNINGSREFDDRNFGAVMIDIDFFKSINDTWGHQVGDAALQDLTTILFDCFRKEDIIGRYGGDEFLVIMHNTNQDGMEQAVLRLKESVDHFNTNGHDGIHSLHKRDYKLNISVGAALYDEAEKLTAIQFIKKVDALMYEEKQRHHIEKTDAIDVDCT